MLTIDVLKSVKTVNSVLKYAHLCKCPARGSKYEQHEHNIAHLETNDFLYKNGALSGSVELNVLVRLDFLT